MFLSLAVTVDGIQPGQIRNCLDGIRDRMSSAVDQRGDSGTQHNVIHPLETRPTPAGPAYVHAARSRGTP